jgi:hypothetical protein
MFDCLQRRIAALPHALALDASEQLVRSRDIRCKTLRGKTIRRVVHRDPVVICTAMFIVFSWILSSNFYN